jgi:4-diphosphocytidyl-2C-methyl-D-erythritol kinase
MIIQAPAKINLALDVLNKREDGYHNIDIVTLPLKLHDIIEIVEGRENTTTHLTSDDLSLACDETNLVYKAYRAVKKIYQFNSGFRIKIYKRIPTEAGLAGGSADAAAVINGLSKLKKLNITDQEKIEIGKNIGSDVPYCIFNKPCRIRGMGEQLSFIKVKKEYHVLIIKPEEGLSTGDVYKEADIIKGQRPDIENLIKGLEEGDDELIAKSMANALQKAAIHLVPRVKNLLDELRNEGLKMVMMSGSGSAIYALSNDKKKLEQLYKKYDAIDDVFPYLTKTTL